MAPTGGPCADGGLSSEEVRARRVRGLVNVTTDDARRTAWDILRANVLTRFNAILGSLLVVVLLTGEYRDALFGIVLIANAMVGIVQELRAKQTMDRLTVLSVPRVRVVRDATEREIAAEDVVVDDLVEIQAGDQIPVDGVVTQGAGLEVDESLLTGESDPVPKPAGAEVRSGSFVVAGGGRFRATAVGDDAYAARLAKEAKRFGAVRSELRVGTDRILRIGTYALVPAAVLLVISQVRSTSELDDALRSSVAGVGAMIPEGLILLTSVAFAVGVVRLGRRRVLVQELAAVEVLARVDVLCVDKTGTLTEGSLRLAGVDGAAGEPAGVEVLAALGALAAADARPNASLRAIAEAVPDPGWDPTSTLPFSSVRKWSGATFAGRGTWLLGAPDVLLDPAHRLARRVEELAADGNRVLLVARSSSPLDEQHSTRPEPVGLVRLQERLRPDAAATLAFFADQGIAIKVISGDHPATVAAVAAGVGVPGGESVDARQLPEDPDELGAVLDRTSLFGRVQPQQKRAMVQALQRRGHVVAMTGDGVNDVLALKDADMGIAMGNGSGASRAVSQMILLDSSFASLPAVFAEGRRVIGNIERVAKLFVTKSVYAFVLAVAVGIAQLPYPFFPRHLTIISTLTIGVPAFFLALAPNDQPARPGFVARTGRFAVPAGFVAAASTFAGYTAAGLAPGVSLIEERTTALIVLFLVAGWILLILARPLEVWKSVLLAAIGATFLATLLSNESREFFELRLPGPTVTLAAIGVAGVAIGMLELGWQVAEWDRRRRS